jgi:PilZ domain
MPSPIPTAQSTRSYKRRSARVQLKIQLSIEIGDDTVLEGETITVSKHGARIRVTSTRGRLSHGEHLRVCVRRGQKAQPARVVWLDKRSDPHYGIELEDDADNFWGVYFPSKDGHWHSGRKDVRRVEAIPAVPEAAPQVAAVAEQRMDAASLIEIGRMPAMIAGFSAVRQPFSERVEMILHGPEEGTALLQNVVEPGAMLKVSFPHRNTKGKVMAIASQAEAGKWRVRIRCDAANA